MATLSRRVLDRHEASLSRTAIQRHGGCHDFTRESRIEISPIVTFAALAAIVTALSGCVIYPIGGGYYYHPYYFHDHDRGWH